jgi:hypothetical protein
MRPMEFVKYPEAWHNLASVFNKGTRMHQPFTPEERERFRARGATDQDIQEYYQATQRYADLVKAISDESMPAPAREVAEQELVILTKDIRTLLSKFGLLWDGLMW